MLKNRAPPRTRGSPPRTRVSAHAARLTTRSLVSHARPSLRHTGLRPLCAAVRGSTPCAPPQNARFVQYAPRPSWTRVLSRGAHCPFLTKRRCCAKLALRVYALAWCSRSSARAVVRVPVAHIRHGRAHTTPSRGLPRRLCSLRQSHAASGELRTKIF